KHLHEIRSADAEERRAGFTSNGLGKKGFTCTWRAHQKYPLGNTGSQFHVFFRLLQKLHNLPKLFLLLICTGHIAEPDTHFAVLIGHAGTALAKGHDPVSTALGLLNKEYPEKYKEHDHGDHGQHFKPPRRG